MVEAAIFPPVIAFDWMFEDWINSNVPMALTTAAVVMDELWIAPITAESANICEVFSSVLVKLPATTSEALTELAAMAFEVTESAANLTALIAPLEMESATTAPL
tara:strand:- start:135 stop:449 length:315 start_codon:yes stop_codon:yes gene_type:complete